MNNKRIGIASLWGLVCGVICLLLGHFAGGTAWSAAFIASGLFNRTLMGFVIGGTGVKGNPFLRGAIYGILMSVGPALAAGFSPDKFIPYCVAGTIYGVLIDGLTSKAFKANVA
jgi:hypothetical protein